MRTRMFALVLTALATGIAWQSVSGQHILRHHHHGAPACEPGYQMVEETIMQQVERFVCKMVPETKKKWVYSWVDDPFCILEGRHGECPQCCGPHCRKQLVKRQIDDPCHTTMKCVTERIVETVPVTVYRKVPCGQAPANMPLAPHGKSELIPSKPLPSGR